MPAQNRLFGLCFALSLIGILAVCSAASSNYTIITGCPLYASNDTVSVAYRVVLADVPTCDPLNAMLAVTSPAGANTTYYPAVSCDTTTGIHAFLISSGESGTYTVQPFNTNTNYNPTNSTECRISSYKRAQLRVPDNNPLIALAVGLLAAGMVAFARRAPRRERR